MVAARMFGRAALGKRVNIIVLDGGRGRLREMHVPRFLAVGVIGVVSVAFAASVWLSLRHFEGAQLDARTVDVWNERLTEHRAELNNLTGQAQTQLLEVGQRLAGMEARLVRMEALGERVSEMAQLTEGEFRFDEPAAVGGPAPRVELDGLIPPAFQERIERLAADLKLREQELSVLDAQVASRRFRDQVAPSGWPVKSAWISSPFGRRADPFSGRPAWHAGMDFAGRPGSDIVAVAGGIVTFAGPEEGYGLMVEVHHGDGLATRYAHAEAVLVAVGDAVKKGQTIAKLGNTGRSTGHHVHFEVLKNGRQVNPARHLAKR